MSWTELHIKTTASHIDELSHALTQFGACAITLKDAGDQPIYEPTPMTPRVWAETIIVGLFEEDQSIEPVLAYLDKQQKEQHLHSFHINSIQDEDWVRRSLSSFKPLQFGNRLWICPSWCQPPDPKAINVILDPGLAFGTGTHPTTALCLEWLDKKVTSKMLLAIDYGCGSGILGIAAHKLGVKKIIAIDNDTQALSATMQNAQQNNIDSDIFTVQLASEPSESIEAKAAIVLANILAKPLISLAPKLAKLTKIEGYIVLSGLLANQVEEVKQAYDPWFEMQPAVFKEDWACLVGIRRKE
jgi:ribosomal protein L11 methyltransferase